MEIIYIIQKSRCRSISVSVMTDNRVLVNAPYGTSERTVQEFFLSKKDWITKHLEKQNREEEKAGELGLLSADEIKQIKKQAKKIIPERVEYWAKQIGVTYGKISIRLQSTRWGSCSTDGNLSFNCLLVLMPGVQSWTPSKQTNQWRRENASFDRLYDLEILDSVVVHELCHRKHMNHSKEFYEEIYRVFPEYDRCNKFVNRKAVKKQAARVVLGLLKERLARFIEPLKLMKQPVCRNRKNAATVGLAQKTWES